MPGTNPYDGRDGYDRAWYDGWVAGNHHRHDTTPAPPSGFPPWDLDAEHLGWFQQVWHEGHLAGREAPEEGMATDVEHHPVHPDHNGVQTGVHVFEGLSLAKSLYKRHWFPAAVEFVLMVMIPSGPPRWVEEEGDLHVWFGGVCREHGFEEVFLPVIWGESDADPAWYGNAYTSWEGARDEANAKIHESGRASIAHWRCDSTEMEVLTPAYDAAGERAGWK